MTITAPDPTRDSTGAATLDSAAVEAGRLIGDVLGDQMTAGMVGGHFTCSEAENIADALVKLGQLDAAATFLAGHAMGDDDPEDDADHLAIDAADDSQAAARDYLSL